MISLDEFLEALRLPLHDHPVDLEQREVIAYPPDKPLIVVAGPGTGKTTTIVARALKMIFVDRFDPASIILSGQLPCLTNGMVSPVPRLVSQHRSW